MEKITSSIVNAITSTLGSTDISLLQGAVLSLFGFVLFWSLKAQASKKKRKAEGAKFIFLVWWESNFWDIGISCIAALALFYASHWSNHLTVGACLAIGVTISTLTNIIKKAI
jgi:hypothetical protein